MKKLLILWLITFSSVLFAQLNIDAEKKLENECNSNKFNSCVVVALNSKDNFKQVELLQKACNGEYIIACGFLADNLFKGVGVRQDKSRAIELHQKACNRNLAFSCVDLGTMFFNGEGVRQDKSKALSLYGKACDLKSESGCELYAQLKNSGVK